MGTLKIPKVAPGKTRPDARKEKTPRNLYAEGKRWSIRFQTSKFNAAGKTRPAAPEQVENPNGPGNKEGLSRRECEVVLDRDRETRPAAPIEILLADRRTGEGRITQRRRESGPSRKPVRRRRTSAMRCRLVRETNERLDEPEGNAQGQAARRDPRGGGTRLFDPEVEVEGTSTNRARSPDAPEGVVDEHTDGIRVRPFSRSGCHLWHRPCTRDLMRTQL